MLRTHTCGELRKKDIKEEVKLSGWNHSRRDHGGVIFIDLRDRYGLTQVVFDPSNDKESHKIAEDLGREDVIQVKGKVRFRGKNLVNPNLDTGEIEVLVDEVEILSKSETPPIEIDDHKVSGEDVRLKYRYLDLRRPSMTQNMVLRNKALKAFSDYFQKNSFLFVQTPMLVKSTPEGARDYVVPSRINKGEFYALPQSPQLYKQILMISGMDRYYQIAVCLRDEDLRQDRQPEHTQMDFEMSFATSDDIREFTEGMYKYVFKEVLGKEFKKDFPVFTYKEAMDKYGTDKPDIRFDLFLHDVTGIVAKSDFKVFKSVAEKGGVIKCVVPHKEFSRNELDKYIDFVQKQGAKGMAWMKVTDKGLESNIAKFFDKKLQKELIRKTGAKPGSVMMFIAGDFKHANQILSKLRLKLAEDLDMIPEEEFKFCWVKDFPLFSWNEEEDRWDPEHHMFTMPKPEFLDSIENNPGEVLGDLWDLTLNGMELGSGSIRVNRPDIQERIMNIIGYTQEEVEEKFGFLLEAYKYGGPPHGGMGLGFDRTVALMAGTTDIREVIAFPKNKAAECPMDGSPSFISKEQLKELGLEVKKKKKKK